MEFIVLSNSESWWFSNVNEGVCQAPVGVAWLGGIHFLWLSLSSGGQQVSLGRLFAQWRQNTRRWKTQFPAELRLYSWTITRASFNWSKRVVELKHTAKVGKAPQPPKRHIGIVWMHGGKTGATISVSHSHWQIIYMGCFHRKSQGLIQYQA